MDRPLTSYQPDQITDGKPQFMVMRSPDTTEWWLDHDGTRYHVITIEPGFVSGTILVAAYPTKGDQHRWAILSDSRDDIAWSYLAEKLGLADGDGPGMSAILTKALHRPIFHVPGVDLPAKGATT